MSGLAWSSALDSKSPSSFVTNKSTAARPTGDELPAKDSAVDTSHDVVAATSSVDLNDLSAKDLAVVLENLSLSSWEKSSRESNRIRIS